METEEKEIIVFVIAFKRSENMRLPFQLGQKLWGLGPGTSCQAVMSKQECMSTLFIFCTKQMETKNK